MNNPDRRMMRRKAREIGIPEEEIDKVLSMPDEMLQPLEFLSVLHSMFNMLEGNLENEKLVCDELENGITVSTFITGDLGPETAIMNGDGIFHPVERYATSEYAEVGHSVWVEKMKRRPKTIQALGIVSSWGEETVNMIYKDSQDNFGASIN